MIFEDRIGDCVYVLRAQVMTSHGAAASASRQEESFWSVPKKRFALPANAIVARWNMPRRTRFFIPRTATAPTAGGRQVRRSSRSPESNVKNS